VHGGMPRPVIGDDVKQGAVPAQSWWPPVYFRLRDVFPPGGYHVAWHRPRRRVEIGPPKNAKKNTMDLPVWLKPAVFGAVAGAIAMSTIGFSQMGWSTAASAEKVARERADDAVVVALVPFCVTKAQHDPDPAVLAKFQTETSSYSRSDMVTKAGWATVGAEKNPGSALARACSDKLFGMKAG